MTDNITLRRAVALQIRDVLLVWSRFALPADKAALAALDAALAEPDATREPATDAEMSAAMTATDIPPGWWFVFQRGFRAAERHHGIRKENGK